MDKISKKLKITNLIGIIACIATYLLSFSPFDKSAVVAHYDDHEFYMQYLVLAMVVAGLITTFFMVGYISAERGQSRSISSMNICMGVLNIALARVGFWVADRLIDGTVFSNYLEETSHFYAMCYKVMIYVVSAIAIIHTINAIVCKMDERKLIKEGVFTAPSQEAIEGKTPVMPIVVAITTVVVTVLGTIGLYGYVFFYCVIPYLLAFALPVCLWLLCIVTGWERQRKYVGVMVSYLVLICLSYGAMHCLFCEPISLFGAHAILVNPAILGGINVAVGAVALVIAIIKWVKQKNR